MPTNVVMPQMGESVYEGSITKWLKNTGDSAEKDEVLFEISTDRVGAEIPSPAAGVLTDIRFPTGATVQVNTVIAVISDPGSFPHSLAAAKEANTVPTAVAAKVGTSEQKTSSPIEQPIGCDAHRGAPSASPGKVVPLSKMRAIIAQRMVDSVQISPHVHAIYKVDMTRIVRIREREKAGFEQRHGVKLTYMPFIATAAVHTLRKFPIVNATLHGEAIQYYPFVNLGIAVALDRGLIVPVVTHAEQRNFLALGRAIVDLAERARSKRLNPDEATGSTFTITNSGIFGEEFGTPIINQPNSAILAIGGLKKEAVVLTDAEGNDSISIRSTQYFCLGFDHRIIDGADAGKFMSEFKKTLENWDEEIG